ncbi:MAG: hypothetical protein LRY46_03280 [Candidatus Pacebacteria bacterium]|nr:hypothetical protein [Candidatus Paceibacterota bacterium]
MNTQQTPSLIDNVMVPLCDMDDHQVTWIKPSLIFTWMGFWLIPKKKQGMVPCFRRKNQRRVSVFNM